jgi:transcriptional regulator GlxA family with amidase domain
MDDRVITVLNTLEEAWNKPIAKNSLAKSVNLSLVRLQHLFKHETGKSITCWVMDHRLSSAARLLLKSSLSIKEIAHQVGFSDPRNFNRSFTHRFGCAPSTFRRHPPGRKTLWTASARCVGVSDRRGGGSVNSVHGAKTEEARLLFEL